MAALTYTDVDDRVQTVLVATGVKAAVNDHAASIDALEGGGALLGHFVGDIAAADFDAEATEQTLTFNPLHATLNAILLDVWIEKVTDFAGGAVSAATLEAGHTMGTPDPNAYVVAQDVFTGAGAGNVGFVTDELGVDRVPATKQPILTATDSLTVTMRTTSADVDALLTGAAKLHAVYRLL